MNKYTVTFKYANGLTDTLDIIAENEDEARRNVQTHLDQRKIDAKVIWVQIKE